MTPEEELRKINRLIHQYATVWRTTVDAEQKARAARELKELRSYRDKILAVNVIDRGKLEEPTEPVDELAEWPMLRDLVAADDQEWQGDQEVHHVALYLRQFEREYLPLLTETRLKLDFKHSMERDGFYRRFEDLRRRMEDWHEARRRLEAGGFNRDLEAEIRNRSFKLKRVLEVDASRFFRSLARFCGLLVEDAKGDGVLCLNGEAAIAFEKIEGEHLLAGRSVSEGLAALAAFAGEVVAYLGIPEIEGQENERADRR